MEACQNCGTELRGKFCYSCGQKVIEPHERRLRHFIYQFFGSAFFLENNFLKNIWTLVSRPGRLPLDFIEGRRKRWMPPFSLFLLLNLFYFWYSPLTDLNLTLAEQLRQPHHSGWVQNLVNNKLARDGITLEKYVARYNQKNTGYSNSLLILHLPIFASFLALIYFRKKYFFADHFIYALYYFAFVLLVGLVQSGMIYSLIRWLGFGGEVFQWMGPLLLGLLIIYTFVSLKTAYYQKSGWALMFLLPVLLAFVVTHLLYRTIQFMIIFLVT